jgi:hypothetical protein
LIARELSVVRRWKYRRTGNPATRLLGQFDD